MATNNGNGAVAGFVSLPDGTFTPDPRGSYDSSVNLKLGNPPLSGEWSHTNFTVLPTYDAQIGRWVPVSPQQLSPDGSQYAYQEWIFPTTPTNGPTGPLGIRIHVVNVATGSDRVVYSAMSQLRTVVAWTQAGVYLTNQCFEGCGNAGGMWLMDPSNGSMSTVLSPERDHTDWRWIANGLAWGMAYNQGVDVNRLNLRTGEVVRWFTPPNAVVIGSDPRGNPLVESQDSATNHIELWDGIGPADGVRLFPGSGSAQGFANFDFPVLDGNRTWIGGPVGLFELGPTYDLVPITVSLAPGSSGIAAAGPCIGG